MYEGYVALAERLNALAPGDFEKKTLLLTTGSEATENAIKIARAATGRAAVISFSYRVSRPHVARALDDGQGRAVQTKFRSVRSRGVPGAVSRRASRLRYGARARPPSTSSSKRASRRATSRRSSSSPCSARAASFPAPFAFYPRATAHRRHARYRARRRRNPDGIRPHRHHVRDRACRGRTRLADLREEYCGRFAARRRGRSRVDRRRRGAGRSRRHVRRESARMCAAALATLGRIRSRTTCWHARERLGRTIRESPRRARRALPEPTSSDVRGLGAMLAVAFADVPDAGGASLGSRVVAAAFEEGVVALTAGPKSNVSAHPRSPRRDGRRSRARFRRARARVRARSHAVTRPITRTAHGGPKFLHHISSTTSAPIRSAS